MLKNLSPDNVKSKTLAGEKILSVLTKAPGNGAPIGGLKVITTSGWHKSEPLVKIKEEVSITGKENIISQTMISVLLKEVTEFSEKVSKTKEFRKIFIANLSEKPSSSAFSHSIN